MACNEPPINVSYYYHLLLFILLLLLSSEAAPGLPLKALRRGEVGLVEDPRSTYPRRPPVDCDVCPPGVWPEIPLPVADKPGAAQLTPGSPPPPPPLSQDQVPKPPHPPPQSPRKHLSSPGSRPASCFPSSCSSPSHPCGRTAKATMKADGHLWGQRGVGQG